MSVFKKIMSAILCLVLLLGTFCGCAEKYSDAIIYFELLEQPKTLDPQMAQSDSELLIVRNIYEGLLRIDSEGSIVNGAAAKCTYNNLTYTFELKDNLVWSDGTPLTAYDFEYGFQRAVDPKIKAPFAGRLFAITNAEAINNGTADISTLGVKAIDEKTLIITLCREDDAFLETITTSVCMPCNKEFFENSIGKYGLDAKFVLSNGSYRITKWNKEDFGIRIYKNEKYEGTFIAQNAAVFISCVSNESQIARLSDGSSDMAFLLGDELVAAKNAGFNNQNVQNICWVLTVSHEFSPQVRKAFAMSFSPEVYKKALVEGFESSTSIYPSILNIDANGVGVTAYDLAQAKTIMSEQIGNMKNGKFPQATLYYYNVYGAKQLATAIVGHWQQNLSTFINIESSNNIAVLQQEIGEGTLQFALFPVTAKSDSFNEYAKNFSAVSTASTPKDLQKELLVENCIIPVAYQTTNITYIPSLENVIVDQDNGYIDFCYIIKK